MSRYSGGAANGTEERLDEVDAKLERLIELHQKGVALLEQISEALKPIKLGPNPDMHRGLEKQPIAPRPPLPAAKAKPRK